MMARWDIWFLQTRVLEISCRKNGFTRNLKDFCVCVRLRAQEVKKDICSKSTSAAIKYSEYPPNVTICTSGFAVTTSTTTGSTCTGSTALQYEYRSLKVHIPVFVSQISTKHITRQYDHGKRREDARCCSRPVKDGGRTYSY
jgi:hypothetical protein